MPFYIKRPPVYEARVWDGSLQSSADLMGWMHNHDVPYTEFEAGKFEGIMTSKDGVLDIRPGDFLVKEDGVFRNYRPDDFLAHFQESV